MYPFHAFHHNSSWWSYPCILPLISNITWSFKLFFRRKKIASPFFTVCFAKAIPWDTNDMRKKLLDCQLLQRKCNGTTSSSTWMLLFWQRHKDNPQKVFRQEQSWVRNVSVRYIFSCCLIEITSTFYCTLYLIHNEWSRTLEKIRGNIKCFSTLFLALTQFISFSYILSSSFYLYHVLEPYFLLAFYKNWM